MANLGSITVNEMEIIEVDASPKVSGVDASIGSLAVLTDGSALFLKTGIINTDWAFRGIEYNYIIAGANQTSTSATYANVTELTSVSLPVGTYMFDCIALCQSTNTGNGVGLRIGAGTATLGTTFGKWDISQAADGTSKSYQYDQLTSTTNVSSINAAVINTNFVVTGKGIFTVSSSGTVAVQFRSEAAVSVSIRTGSFVHFKRVS